MTRKSVILISPFFPPSSLAGVHRARHLAKHLPHAGWRPIVLCVDEADYEQGPDPNIKKLVPLDTEIVKVGALSHGLTRFFGIGEISLRAWYPLRRALFRLLSTEPVGAVLITGSPYYPMLLASEIKRRFGVPVVLDFQDPWVSDWGAAQPIASKAGISHALARLLEPRAVAAASFVTSVSDVQNRAMAARYPWFDPSRMSGIPIGGDPEDFVALREMDLTETSLELDDDRLHFSYVGTFLPRARSLVRLVFRAYARLCKTAPRIAERIQFNFVGTSNQFGGDDRALAVTAIAEQEGVAAAVCETPQRIPYLEALNVLARSRCLLLIGSDEPHYTASKIYPALMSGRPFLSLFHAASSAHRILSSAGGGHTYAFADADSLNALEVPFSESLRQLALEPESVGLADPAAYASYNARNIAAEFARVFDAVALS